MKENKFNKNNCSILKRGLPIIYEYSKINNDDVNNNNIINISIGVNNYSEKKFNNELFKYLSELFKTKIICKISLLQLKIISEFSFQISYDLEYKNWLLTSNEHNKCIIFNDLNDSNNFLKEKKISNNEYQIIKIWLNFLNKNFLNEEFHDKNKDNELNEFLKFCNKNTLLGFYVGDKNSIFTKDFNEKKLIFFNIISNHEKFSNFSLSFSKTENFFIKYNLNYINFIKIKDNIYNIETFKKEINNLYHNICEDFSKNQKCGSLFVIQSEKRIVSSFKIINNETKVLYDIKKNLQENINEEEFYKKFKKLKLPRSISYYLDKRIEFKKNENDNDICNNDFDKNEIIKNANNNIENNNKNIDEIKNVINNNKENSDIKYNIKNNNNNNKLFLLDETNEIIDNNNNDALITSFIYKENDNDKKIVNNNSIGNYNNNIKTIKNINNNIINNKNINNNFNTKEFSFGSHFNSETDDYSIKHSKTISKKYDKIFNNKFNLNKRKISNSQYHFLKKNNSINKINKKNKRVKFNDIAFNKPLVDVIIIKSFKKYNASNNYNGNDEKEDNKNICCLIF